MVTTVESIILLRFPEDTLEVSGDTRNQPRLETLGVKVEHQGSALASTAEVKVEGERHTRSYGRPYEYNR